MVASVANLIKFIRQLKQSPKFCQLAKVERAYANADRKIPDTLENGRTFRTFHNFQLILNAIFGGLNLNKYSCVKFNL